MPFAAGSASDYIDSWQRSTSTNQAERWTRRRLSSQQSAASSVAVLRPSAGRKRLRTDCHQIGEPFHTAPVTMPTMPVAAIVRLACADRGGRPDARVRQTRWRDFQQHQCLWHCRDEEVCVKEVMPRQRPEPLRFHEQSVRVLSANEDSESFPNIPNNPPHARNALHLAHMTL